MHENTRESTEPMTQAFYDDLAARYHLIFEDWDASIARQAAVLTTVLAARGIRPPAAVLDAACGIGTQALGLAGAGFTVTGADLSPRAVDRARREAAARNLRAEWLVADMRSVHTAVPPHGFAAVMSCDNALPHLLTNTDLVAALRALRECLAPEGWFVASIRDYDALLANRPAGTEPLVFVDTAGRRRITGQAWTWRGEMIDVTLFLSLETGDERRWETHVDSMTYRAYRRREIDAALTESGYGPPQWFAAGETGFHQPIVIAPRAPAAA